MATDGLRRHGFLVRYLTLFGGEAASKVAVLVAFGYLARTIGPAGLGIVELAFSTTVFFVLAAEMGLGTYGAKLIEASPVQARTLIPRIGLVRGVLGTIAFLAVVVISARSAAPVMGLLAICGAAVLLTPFNTPWVFQGLRQMQWVALGGLLRYATFALIVLLFVRPGSDVRLVALAEVSGAAAMALFNVVVIRQVFKFRLDFTDVAAGARHVLRHGWFLGASDLTWAAMWFAPTIVLGWIHLSRPEEVAWLAAAVRIVVALHTFVFLYFFNLVPNLSRELRVGIDSWRALVARSMAMSTWAAGAFVVAGTLASPLILTTLFGQKYEAAVLPFRIVLWMIPVAWLSGHFRFSLIVAGRQDLEFTAAAIGGVTTVVAATAGAMTFGASGAAAGLLAGGVVNALASGIAIARSVGAVPLAPATPALIAVLAALGLGIMSEAVMGGVVGTTLACTVYALLALRSFDLAAVRIAFARTPRI